MKWLVLLLAPLIGCSTTASTSGSAYREPKKVHLVISYSPEKRVERIYRSKEEALSYIEEYQPYHDYFYEERVLDNFSR